MLKGFSTPLTPRGISSITPPPPWHYSCDFLTVDFWADPAVVAEYLPQGLTMDKESNGHANAFFCDWQFTGEKQELLDPARYQYREFFILLDARYHDQPVSYCPYMFVDNDAALARGWAQGYPKRFASVYQTRLHAAPGKAAPQLAPGSLFAASASAAGRRIAECCVTLQVPVTEGSGFSPRLVVNLLHTPSLAAGQHSSPKLHDLVMNVPRDVRIDQLWGGEGELVFPACEGEELSDLRPLRCGFGARGSMSYTVDDLKFLETVPSYANLQPR